MTAILTRGLSGWRPFQWGLLGGLNNRPVARFGLIDERR
jgi:hypothetical protein